MSLFIGLERRDWTPPAVLPDLSGERCLWFDVESTGKDPHKDVPVGLSISTDRQSWYVPFGHNGGNLDENMVKAWARSSSGLRGKTLIGSWIKIDAHFMANWDVDLAAIDVNLRDIQHQACLLNENRRRSGLDLLAKERLNRGKLELPFNIEQIGMREVHSSLVGPYAMEDTALTRDLDLAYGQDIIAEGLSDVLQLEDSIILPVVEMERNGALLDIEKLERWRKEVRADYERGLYELKKMAGFLVNPDSQPDMRRLFNKLNLPIPTAYDEKKRAVVETFSREALLHVYHPLVPLLLRVKSRASLLSKYLDKYAKGHRNGILRYLLHQLRADENGTITGRFSSAGLDTDYGANIQQVFKPGKQLAKLGEVEWNDARHRWEVREGQECPWPVRELFICAEGSCWIAADADQIEYRIFADLARNPTILAEYAKDPTVNYHKVVLKMANAAGSNPGYDHLKNVNFAKLYGAGPAKLSRMLGLTREETDDFLAMYDRLMPEVKPTMDRVTEQIVRRYHETGVGYVRTRMGRKRRFTEVDEKGRLKRTYAGLNAHIQGTAADIMKVKIREAYRHRKDLDIVMRMTVHDELDCDGRSPRSLKLEALLNEQVFPEMRVPILWSMDVGFNWAKVTKPSKHSVISRWDDSNWGSKAA